MRNLYRAGEEEYTGGVDIWTSVSPMCSRKTVRLQVGNHDEDISETDKPLMNLCICEGIIFMNIEKNI